MAAPSAIFVHGRTREARYRHPADWDAIAEIAAAVPVPVIGNGDLLFGHEFHERLADVRLRGGDGRARRADQAVDLSRADARRTGTSPRKNGWRSTGATSRWPRALGRRRIRPRPAPRIPPVARRLLVPLCAADAPDGSWPTMQQREGAWAHASPLEALLARTDDAALDYVTDELLSGGDLSKPPAAGAGPPPRAELVEAGDDRRGALAALLAWRSGSRGRPVRRSQPSVEPTNDPRHRRQRADQRADRRRQRHAR